MIIREGSQGPSHIFPTKYLENSELVFIFAGESNVNAYGKEGNKHQRAAYYDKFWDETHQKGDDNINAKW